MSEPGKAVFLSYASQDAEAARRIAEALRAAGVEVWFDHTELRGGDAWDQKIRRQIRECALFVPIISAHSQERIEGYFRLEWKLAVDRSHLMADDVPFLFPIVTDDTTDAQARVPDRFRERQWTRLLGGHPTREFVLRMQRLLEAPEGEGLAQASSLPAGGAGGQLARESGGISAPPRRGMPGWAWGALGLVVLGGLAGAYFAPRRPAPAPRSSSAAASSLTPSSLPPSRPAAPDAKSIAVLPFENMSADQGNAYFCEGVQEAILTDLTNIRELHVISRTSVERYRNTTKPLAQIARALHVAWILEGSVQRQGDQVRVTSQLINPRTGENVWAQTYDRNATDILAIESQIAQAIAGALQAKISPAEQGVLDRRRTASLAAYKQYLQARQLENSGVTTPANLQKQIQLLQSAVRLDPDFAEAWANLADIGALAHFNYFEGSDALLTQARAAIDQATRLAPDDPTVIAALGTYYYYGLRDYTRAAAQYDRLARLQPNNPTIYEWLGLILRRQGRWAESLADTRRAGKLDPANVKILHTLLVTLRAGRRWDEAMTTQRRIIALLPNNLTERLDLAVLDFEATGSTRDGEKFFAGLSPAQRDSPLGIGLRESWAVRTGDFAEAVRLDHRQPYFKGYGTPQWIQAYQAARWYFSAGDRAGAKTRLGNYPAELRQQLKRQPNDPSYWAILGGMDAILGHRDEARRDVDHAVALLPESRDAIGGASLAVQQAMIYDWTGAKDRALADYARLLQVPGGPNVHDLKAAYSTLRGDPRFEALLKDPKNNAPLF